MKLTAVLVAVMLPLGGILFVGCSFNIKEKAGSATHVSEPVLSEVSLKEEKAIPSPQPLYKQEASLKTAQLKPIEPHIGTIKLEGFAGIGCADVPPPPEEENSISIKEDDSDKLMPCNVETEAEYPGGPAAWQRYLNKNMRFPVDSIDDEIQGSVVVRFVVDEAGNVCDVEAVKGSASLVAEAMRVIKQSGKWIPAKQLSTGRCVRSFKTQPFVICFAVEE
jgi:protein TonB